MGILNTTDGWSPAIESRGGIRDGAWVAEATGLVTMSSWPPGTRLILRTQRPHPGTQLRFTDSNGAGSPRSSLTPATAWSAASSADSNCGTAHTPRWRTGSAKPGPPGCVTCHRFDANAAWLEIILAATDLVAWTKLIGTSTVLVQPVPLLAVEQLSDCTSHPAARL